MGGMYAGFSLSRYQNIWAVGSEMPFVSAKAAALLQERKQDGFDAVLPLIKGGVYPLHGIYDKSGAGQMQILLEKGEKSVSALLRTLYWADLPDTLFLEHGIDTGFIKGFDAWEEYESMKESPDEKQASREQLKL